MPNVSGSDLPGGSVVSEIEEHGSEPVVNLIQSALFVWRLEDRLQTVKQSEKHTGTKTVIQRIDK